MTSNASYPSPLGTMLLQANGGAVTGVWFVGAKFAPAFDPPPVQASDRRPSSPAPAAEPALPPADNSPVLSRLAAWLDAYFAGLNPPIDFPLAPAGTPFQLKTWGRLREVPYGTTTTYGQLAGGTSARAVGSAVGRNPISILIPCHRVVGAGGSLIGYAAGIERKQALLELEGVLM